MKISFGRCFSPAAVSDSRCFVQCFGHNQHSIYPWSNVRLQSCIQHGPAEMSTRARSWMSGKRNPPLKDVRCHLLTSAGTMKSDCPRIKLCKELVQRLGGEVTAARRCDVCVVVSHSSPGQQTCGGRKCNGTKSTQRQSPKAMVKCTEICAGRVRLPHDAVIVFESWLVETLLTGKKQSTGKHMYMRP